MLQIAVFVLLAKFPRYYMKFYLFGEGCAAVFNSILQILTLAIGTSTKTSALIYFGIGSGVMSLTLILFFFSKYNDFYMYFVKHFKEDITRDMLSVLELKQVLKTIWPVLLMFVFYELAKIPHVPVTSLVVSENYGSGNNWNGKFCEWINLIVVYVRETRPQYMNDVKIVIKMFIICFRCVFCTSSNLLIWWYLYITWKSCLLHIQGKTSY